MKSLIAILCLILFQLGVTSYGSVEAQEFQTSSSGVVWFDMMVSDVSRATHFYSTLFRWRFKAQSADYYIIETENGPIGGLSTFPSGSGAGIAIYFDVRDLAAKLAQAVALGAEVLVQPMNLPLGQGSIALFKDLDGNPVGMFSKNPI